MALTFKLKSCKTQHRVGTQKTATKNVIKLVIYCSKKQKTYLIIVFLVLDYYCFLNHSLILSWLLLTRLL